MLSKKKRGNASLKFMSELPIKIDQGTLALLWQVSGIGQKDGRD